MLEWIESIILEGWNLYNSNKKILAINKELTDKIVQIISEEYTYDNLRIQELKGEITFIVYSWIDHILLINWGFYRDSEKLKEYSSNIAKDLISLIMEEKRNE